MIQLLSLLRDQGFWNQETDFSNYNREEVNEVISRIKAEKERRLKDELDEIYELVNTKMQRILDLSQEKGSGL